MLKKMIIFSAIFAMFLFIASPASAVLKVLDPEISEELRAIAKQHLADTLNVNVESITVEDGWLREFFNVNAEVYMIHTIIDKGLATESKAEVAVRVDTKAVLTEAELAQLQEEDAAAAPDEPVARIMTADIVVEEPVEETAEDAVAEAQPVAEDLVQDTAQPTGNNTMLFIAGAVLLAAILAGGAFALIKKKA